MLEKNTIPDTKKYELKNFVDHLPEDERCFLQSLLESMNEEIIEVVAICADQKYVTLTLRQNTEKNKSEIINSLYNHPIYNKLPECERREVIGSIDKSENDIPFISLLTAKSVSQLLGLLRDEDLIEINRGRYIALPFIHQIIGSSQTNGSLVIDESLNNFLKESSQRFYKNMSNSEEKWKHPIVSRRNVGRVRKLLSNK